MEVEDGDEPNTEEDNFNDLMEAVGMAIALVEREAEEDATPERGQQEAEQTREEPPRAMMPTIVRTTRECANTCLHAMGDPRNTEVEAESMAI